MSDAQLSPDAAHDAFDKLLVPTFTTDEHGEQVQETPEPEPDPTPEPEPDPDPKPAASAAAEPPKIDRRTRAGKQLSIQQQIDADTARRHTAKTEADAEETRLATLRAERARLEAPPPQQPAPPPPAASQEWKRYAALPDAPKMEDFPGETGFVDWQYAVGTFIADKRFDERMQRHTQQQQVTTSQVAFRTRMDAELKTDPTFTEKLQQTPVDTRMIPYLHRHAQGPEIMVYLVRNPELAQRLATLNLDSRSELPSASQIEAIGEIVATLKARTTAALPSGPASSPSPISRAKPLIKPVSGTPQASDDDDEDDESISVDEHIRRGNRHDGLPPPRAARY